ncbi:MAG TPA: DUF2155 domain-containing protein [Rickettsiales bacterium]|nr:DUF2155 domain-containing protein [Rickettsiales bacterium]
MKIINIFLVIFFAFNCFAQETISNNVENLDNQEIIQQPTLKVKDIKSINQGNVVVLEGLNKITAKSYKYNVKIGESIDFERLTIKPLVCWKSSPDQVSENKVLLKIIETSVDGNKKQIFYGWMFSSSPSASSMEHPMYDIRVVDCLKNNDSIDK